MRSMGTRTTRHGLRSKKSVAGWGCSAKGRCCPSSGPVGRAAGNIFCKTYPSDTTGSWACRRALTARRGVGTEFARWNRTSNPLDHYADAVFSEPGRCWRMIQQAGVGAPDHCSEPGNYGGGIYNSASLFLQSASTVVDNNAGVLGGGVYNACGGFYPGAGAGVTGNTAPTSDNVYNQPCSVFPGFPGFPLGSGFPPGIGSIDPVP